MSIFKTYIQFWLKVFDFKGTSSRRQFWIPTLINYTAPTLLVIIWYILYPIPLSWKTNIIIIINVITKKALMPPTGQSVQALSIGNVLSSLSVINSILIIVGTLIIIANLSIMVRRIRDTGFNPIIIIIIYITLLLVNAIIGLAFLAIILLIPTSSSNPKASKFYNYNNYNDDEWTEQ